MLLPLFLIRARLLSDPKLFGRWGEKLALRYLKGRGYKVLALNFMSSAGEIDLIVSSKTGTIVFIEVKSRRSEEIRTARGAVNPGKQKKIAATARAFLKKYNIRDRAIRFDVLTVILPDKGRPDISHYQNAFQPKW